ncbi:hypothetical protein IKP85_02445 [bacterium]|nr:hypothetical protein [bacterium]
MNNSYYETLDENFNEALNLIDKDLTHSELVQMLLNGNIPQKQLAALRLEELTSKDDAAALLNNLVGQDGKIREAVSLKIKELAADNYYKKYFYELDNETLSDYFLAAIIDINGNICRNILDTIIYFEDNNIFTGLFTNKLVKLIYELNDKIKDFDFQDGKYKVNKEVFKLYWCLEAVNIYYNKIPLSDLKNIIKTSKNIDEYTIREKVAKILTNDIKDKELLIIREELKNDKNYYVRRILN